MGDGGGGLLSAKSAQRLVAKLYIYREIELLLLVPSVFIKTFDLKLDFSIYFLCIIEFKIKIYINIYYGNINNCPQRFACHLISYIQKNMGSLAREITRLIDENYVGDLIF